MTKMVLDPGHGGTSTVGGSSPNNAVGPAGLLEKAVTLDVAKKAASLLQSKAHLVKLTRMNDQNVGLKERAAVAKASASPVFVSIHLNGFNNSTQGTETICDTVHLTISADLCRAVQKKMVAATGHNDRNASHPDGVKRQSLGVLKPDRHHTKTACCLVEISFMDVAAEEARLKTSAYVDKIAKALSDRITDYLSAANLESAAGSVFGDGFEAQGKKGSLPRSNRKTAAKKSRTSLSGVPKKASSRSMNDKKEFSEVEIGAGFDPDTATESLESGPGFDMAAFRAFVAGLDLRHFGPEELLFMGKQCSWRTLRGTQQYASSKFVAAHRQYRQDARRDPAEAGRELPNPLRLSRTCLQQLHWRRERQPARVV
ncbi:N-acetylmuramoyl-L-alanine amidase [Rhizobium ruizarguesonis]